MSATIEINGINLAVSLDDKFNFWGDYHCPKCQSQNRINLSAAKAGDAIACPHCRDFSFVFKDAGYRGGKQLLERFVRDQFKK